MDNDVYITMILKLENNLVCGDPAMSFLLLYHHYMILIISRSVGGWATKVYKHVFEDTTLISIELIIHRMDVHDRVLAFSKSRTRYRFFEFS